jgi:hypothetical protein
MTVGNIVAFTGFGNIEPLNIPENEPASKFVPYAQSNGAGDIYHRRWRTEP